MNSQEKSPIDVGLLKNELMEQAKHISFDVENHRYFNQSGEEYISVSSILSKFSIPFDKEKISQRIAKRDKKPVNEITTQWDIRRDLAIVRGTEFHLYVETYLNTGRKIETITPIEKEKAAFHLFWEKRNHGRYEIMINELRICDDEYKIAGTVDCIVRNTTTNSFFIFDWKTNQEIKTKNKYQKMIEPLNHLDDCEFNKYSLQMSFYRYLLQKSGLVDIKKCYLIHLSPSEGSIENKKLPYSVIETADYSEFIPTMLKKI